jgi:hypothetical protein
VTRTYPFPSLDSASPRMISRLHHHLAHVARQSNSDTAASTWNEWRFTNSRVYPRSRFASSRSVLERRSAKTRATSFVTKKSTGPYLPARSFDYGGVPPSLRILTRSITADARAPDTPVLGHFPRPSNSSTIISING